MSNKKDSGPLLFTQPDTVTGAGDRAPRPR
jgi:hypothetical protein